ncbi:MAG: response regulator [Synergistaceae bacterium]|jgi:PAS domain S-box-containing protein|nr:response regulator [Synergistaceae bacterium]
MTTGSAICFTDHDEARVTGRAEESKKEKHFALQAKYMNLLLENSLNTIMFLNKDGVIDFCSERMVRTMAVSDRSAIQGRHFSEVYGSFAHEAFIQGAERTFLKIQTDKKPVEEELKIAFPGVEIPHVYVVQSIPLVNEDGFFEGAQVVFFDSATLVTSVANKHVQAMLDAAPLMVSIWDEKGNMLDCNREALRLLGLSKKTDYTESFYELQPEFQPDGERSIDKAKQLIRAAFETGYRQFEWTYRAMTGELLPVETTLVRISWEDGFRLAAYSRDLREFKAKEAEVREANERGMELEVEKRTALAASGAKSAFLASMSHEIRTPMNAIIGMSDLIRVDNLDDQQKAYLRDIQKTSHTLLQIINEILDFSKIEAGKMDLVPANYSILALYHNICSLIHVSMENKGLQFRHGFADDIPEILFGDEVRVQQIILNILNNAVKYTAEGYVELQMTRAMWKSCDCLAVTVGDTGSGIKEEDLPRLFDKFTQFGFQKHRELTGTGLGLSIAKQLTDMMKGDIIVESEYGRGTTFTVYLPLVEGNPEKLERERAFRRVMARPDVKVLVVDDNAINLTVALGYLQRHDIKADTSESGAKAIDMVQAKPYDLVFMDHMMPEMDGMETMERIRALPDQRCREVPIVVLSANAIAGMEQTFLEAGMSDFLSKPIDPLKLNRVLIDWLPPEKLFLSEPEKCEESGKNSDALRAKLETYESRKKNEAREKRNVVLDLEASCSNFPGGETAYRKILSNFGRNHDADSEVIASMLEAGDAQGARRFVHALKNAAALIGTERLRAAASALETALSEDTEATEATEKAPWGGPLETMRTEMSFVLDELAKRGTLE